MKAEVLADGLYFGEGLRWHAARLWFGDIYEHAPTWATSASRSTRL